MCNVCSVETVGIEWVGFSRVFLSLYLYWYVSPPVYLSSSSYDPLSLTPAPQLAPEDDPFEAVFSKRGEVQKASGSKKVVSRVPRTFVLSHLVWVRRFGAKPSYSGRTLLLFVGDSCEMTSLKLNGVAPLLTKTSRTVHYS